MLIQKVQLFFLLRRYALTLVRALFEIGNTNFYATYYLLLPNLSTGSSRSREYSPALFERLLPSYPLPLQYFHFLNHQLQKLFVHRTSTSQTTYRPPVTIYLLILFLALEGFFFEVPPSFYNRSSTLFE